MSDESEKRKEILELLASGKISAAAAAELLSSSQESIQESFSEPEAIKISKHEVDNSFEKDDVNSDPTWLRVRVSDMKTGKGKVSVNIPLRLVKFGLAIGSRFAPELDDMDWNQVTGMLSSEKGILVDVQDEEDGEHVQIYVD